MRQSGDFEEFYLASYGRVKAVVLAILGNRDEADDVTQEAFARALARWPRLSSYDLPEAWVRQVALRLAIDSGRRFLRMLRILPALRPPACTEADPADSLLFTPLGQALRELPMREREVVVLYYVADLPVERIAHDLGVNLSTVKARLVAGRRRLEQALAPDLEGVRDA